MYELVTNLHIHTRYSDGHFTHSEIAATALEAGLDVVIVTDHNVWVNHPEGYLQQGQKKVLMLVGEEVHDRSRLPQKDHLLVFGANRELSPLAGDLPRLLEAVRQSGGLAFLAHPVDPPAPLVREVDISWVSWDVQDFTGIELWNAMSEFKSLLKSYLHAIYYAYFPNQVACGPFPATLRRWDDLLARGRPVVAIGGSDAHAFRASLGPLHRTLFPYKFHFQAINTHLFTAEPPDGDAPSDRRLVLEALRLGRAFVGYDLPASTRGFRFTAAGKDGSVWMGDDIALGTGVTLQVRLPRRTECRLIKDGKLVKTWHNRDTCTYIATQPGVYRVEVYLVYLGKRRGWIYSNPIYVKT